MKYETKTFASMTTPRTSDASSTLSCFMDCFHSVVRSTLHKSLPAVQARAVRGDPDASALHFPRELVSRSDVKRFTNFLRYGRLSLAGDRRGNHCLVSL